MSSIKNLSYFVVLFVPYSALSGGTSDLEDLLDNDLLLDEGGSVSQNRLVSCSIILSFTKCVAGLLPPGRLGDYIHSTILSLQSRGKPLGLICK